MLQGQGSLVENRHVLVARQRRHSYMACICRCTRNLQGSAGAELQPELPCLQMSLGLHLACQTPYDAAAPAVNLLAALPHALGRAVGIPLALQPACWLLACAAQILIWPF